MTSERNTARDYIDNAALYNAFVEWYAARDRAAQNGQPEPEPPTLIGEAILLIPQRLATKGNFCNYTYREEMVSDAVENLVRVYRNFDPNKSKNPFAYFTQISYYAFLKRIHIEKRNAYIKHKMIQNSTILETVATQVQDAGEEYSIPFNEILQQTLKPELERLFETPKRERVVKSKYYDLEDLFGGNGSENGTMEDGESEDDEPTTDELEAMNDGKE